MHGGRIKFKMFDNDGNPVNPKFKSKRKVFQAIGEWIVKSKKRTDPELRALKEREEEFDFKKEQAIVDNMI